MSRTRGSTPTEVKIRKLYAITYRSWGYSVSEIARKLEVTRRTVFNYLKDYPYILTNQELMDELNEIEREWNKRRISEKLKQQKVFTAKELTEYYLNSK